AAALLAEAAAALLADVTPAVRCTPPRPRRLVGISVGRARERVVRIQRPRRPLRQGSGGGRVQPGERSAAAGVAIFIMVDESGPDVMYWRKFLKNGYGRGRKSWRPLQPPPLGSQHQQAEMWPQPQQKPSPPSPAPRRLQLVLLHGRRRVISASAASCSRHHLRGLPVSAATPSP
ncbi:unnamed protein product, partial [Urochloa humidicola]